MNRPIWSTDPDVGRGAEIALKGAAGKRLTYRRIGPVAPEHPALGKKHVFKGGAYGMRWFKKSD
jgi:hypothetical protein